MHWQGSVISIYGASTGSVSKATNIAVYFHHQGQVLLLQKERKSPLFFGLLGRLMRAIGWNIWKGFNCFSSSAWLGSLVCIQKSTAIPTSHQLRIKEVWGGALTTCNYSIELLMFNESTPTMRKHIIHTMGSTISQWSTRDHSSTEQIRQLWILTTTLQALHLDSSLLTNSFWWL